MLENTCLNHLEILWIPMAFFTRHPVPTLLNKTGLLNAKTDTLLKILKHSWFMATYPFVFGVIQCSLPGILLTACHPRSLITKYLTLCCFPNNLSIPYHLVYSGPCVLSIISFQDLINSRLSPLNVFFWVTRGLKRVIVVSLLSYNVTLSRPMSSSLS